MNTRLKPSSGSFSAALNRKSSLSRRGWLAVLAGIVGLVLLSGQGVAGGRIAYISNETGNYEIYVMDADGSNVQRLTNTPQNEVFPDWTAFSYAVEPAGKLPTTWGETKTN